MIHNDIGTTDNTQITSPARSHRLRKVLLLLAVVVIIQFIIIAWLAVELVKAPAPSGDEVSDKSPGQQAISTETPKFKEEVIVQGRMNVWDVVMLPGKQLLFTERSGSVNLYDNGKVKQVAAVSDVAARGEGGLMGMALDPQFGQNRYLYLCFNSTEGDIRVARWKLANDLSSLSGRNDIITGIAANPSGRHSGCRVAFGPDSYLWTGTGDSAQSTQPQQPASLNGKILRTDRDGKAVSGNQGGGFDSRVYSYGHRNTQGIAFFPKARNGLIGVTAEHGSTVDDELNPLTKGNFGWAPPEGYDEDGVAMTDTKRFPDAVKAIWSSGRPTQAPSGIAVINGSAWKGWNGAVAMAMLRDRHLKILRLDDDNKVTKEEKVLDGIYGRLRMVYQAADGNLYVTTDNKSNDKIIRLIPN
jgi:aldose sugar dehydrogenase